MRTWQIEAAVALLVLGTVAVLGGNHATEWLGAGAVWLSFMHGQVADRMAESQGRRAVPDVHCYRRAALYFIGKEALWVAYFVAHRSYAALAGCALFLAYPAWRKVYRKISPRLDPFNGEHCRRCGGPLRGFDYCDNGCHSPCVS